MAGDIANASIWPDADIYVAPLGTALPVDVDTAFAGTWELVGLLDGSAGIAYGRAEDKNDLFAWGGILVRTSRAHFKATATFTALEDNDVTRDLIWPGSSATSIVVPRPTQVLMAFETVEGDTVKRLITSNYAECDINGDIVDKEDDLTKYEIVATIFPDATLSPPELFVRQFTAGGS